MDGVFGQFHSWRKRMKMKETAEIKQAVNTAWVGVQNAVYTGCVQMFGPQ